MSHLQNTPAQLIYLISNANRTKQILNKIKIVVLACSFNESSVVTFIVLIYIFFRFYWLISCTARNQLMPIVMMSTIFIRKISTVFFCVTLCKILVMVVCYNWIAQNRASVRVARQSNNNDIDYRANRANTQTFFQHMSVSDCVLKVKKTER